MKHASERELWVAVILQATEDGLKDKRARAWFQPANADFVDVCSLAGLDPDNVAERAANAFRRSDNAEAIGHKFEIAKPEAAAPRQATRYEHDGKSLTVREWSKLSGVKESNIRDRLRFGYSIAEATNPNFRRKKRSVFNDRPGRKPKLHTINGISKTLSEWCNAYDISYHSLAQRMKRGMTLEHALAHSKSGKRASLLHTVDGVSKTYGEWADHLGISYDAFLKRLKDGNGRTVAQAVAMGGPRRRKTPGHDRGVVADFAIASGTAGGSFPQEIPEITFSEKAENE
ncbi:MAG: hypothetical protein EOS81_07110 [Mesorhizobium sp.]|uniref:hypothetical protein n=1 Tax=Mesorhizobium sp. TaxID=1871066 RepID=UPI000FD1FA6A|nr:hypothetical protein EN759_27025 [Mesorhizobium sp. M00.F.Ca.ET.038.03.1.1]RWF03157.1 MAG: hypothetical protein EOS81_07110 [Mesorhizobium sp.]